jgi:RNA polymerase sigma-70 factor (ECF subfamily)
VFAHLGAIAAYARRRGSLDADALAAEVMTIAWRRLADVPEDDPRPWLYATARNLVYAEFRKAETARRHEHELAEPQPPNEVFELDPQLAAALGELSPLDREALLLTAWEELPPKEAARALGIKATAFRVRLLRARRRIEAKLAESAAPPDTKLTMERT